MCICRYRYISTENLCKGVGVPVRLSSALLGQNYWWEIKMLMHKLLWLSYLDTFTFLCCLWPFTVFFLDLVLSLTLEVNLYIHFCLFKSWQITMCLVREVS